jgi:hypothetical protein
VSETALHERIGASWSMVEEGRGGAALFSFMKEAVPLAKEGREIVQRLGFPVPRGPRVDFGDARSTRM